MVSSSMPRSLPTGRCHARTRMACRSWIFILGDGVTSFLEHNVFGDSGSRLYYVDDEAGNIVIEVASVPAAMGFDAFMAAATPVVEALRFATP